ncbi:MAG TPA: VPLPA-CTERM sorting domain-containing protein [Gammaproteobacteria bacterium]|nr:VPLPA-CTERM sorting domain-containing protein [Gammaproteobacteria bacterium]
MKLLRLATAVAMAVMSSGVSAAAITIPGMLYAQSVSFDSPAPTLLSYDEFNPSLGTLDSVDITFTGLATIKSLTQPNVIMSGILPTPVSYSVPIDLNLGFDSISRGFKTTLDSIAPLTVMADGAGDAATTIMPFSFSFTIDHNQDYGVPVFADPDGSGSASSMIISASLADFLPIDPLLTGLPIYTSFTATTLSFDPRVNPFLTTLSGAMQINYWYTKEIQVSPVPLPAAAWLFGSGLLGLVSVARPKKAA